jgi:hypothetical protein
LQSVFACQSFQSYFHLIQLHFFFHFLFPLFVSQGIIQAPLNAHRLRQWRIGFTHIAFERKTGIGLFKNVPGWAGSPAEVALIVFLSIDYIFVSAHAFGNSIFARVHRKIYISQGFTNQMDAGPRRIIAAVFWGSVKGGAYDLACPAAIAFIYVNLDYLDFLFNFAHF